MTRNATIGLFAAGTLAILLYASSKKANGNPKTSTPGNGLPAGSPPAEPSPAPIPDPIQRLITLGFCCPDGQTVSGDRCMGADAGGNYVYQGPAYLCRVASTSTAPSNLVNIFKRNDPSAPAIKCCDARDKECHCTSWHWSKSADCKDAACGSAKMAGGLFSNLMDGNIPRNAFNDLILSPAS